MLFIIGNIMTFLINNTGRIITFRKFVTVMFYKLYECNTIHHLLEYMGNSFKDRNLHCEPMTNCCEFRFLLGADLLPLLNLK